MEEQDCLGPRRFRGLYPGLQLPRSTGWTLDHTRSCSPGQAPSVVAAATVDDDDLGFSGASAQHSASDVVGLVERGYHHRDLHPATIAVRSIPEHRLCDAPSGISAPQATAKIDRRDPRSLTMPS